MLRPWKLAITLDRNSPLSVQLQIVHAVAEEIRRGRLRPGVALPGSRDLAADLGVNRKTVILAYEELVAQGWLTSEGRRGTFVSAELPSILQDEPPPPLRPAAPPAAGSARPPGFVEFRDGVPDTRGIPFDVLSRAFRHALIATARTNRLSYGDARGEPALRRAVASMLAMERGLDCGPEGICVVRGSQMGIFVAARLTVRPGDAVVMEELCYPPARKAFMACGAEVLAVGLDRSGMDVDALEAICRRRPVTAVYTTPHHQYPTTVMMAAERRLKLLMLAERHGFKIIEDDYDHEFHFSRGPVMPLASMDRSGSVIYIGSLSKVLAPGLRVGYLAAAPEFIDRCGVEVALIDRQGNAITELAVAELMESGELKRHARRMLKLYRGRREAFAALLSERLAGMADFTLPEGGLAFWLRLVGGVRADVLCRIAGEEGVGLSPGSAFSIDGRDVAGLRLGFGDLDAAQIRSGVHRLERAFTRLG